MALTRSSRRTHQSGPLGELFDHGEPRRRRSRPVHVSNTTQVSTRATPRSKSSSSRLQRTSARAGRPSSPSSHVSLHTDKHPNPIPQALTTPSPSPLHLLRPDLGRIPHKNPYPRHRLGPCGRHPHAVHRLRLHRRPRRRQLLAKAHAAHARPRATRLYPRGCVRAGVERVVHGLRRARARLQHVAEVCPVTTRSIPARH